jgi:dTDP-4-amino-4,6-dideoxygalactose transaminase
MSSPDLTDAETEAVNEVLQTQFLSIGPKVGAFEQAFAAYTGTQYGIGVSSGTSGLHLCMIAANVGAGDIVITTPFSFIASANCVLYERAVPLFVDVDPLTGNIDPTLVVQAVEDIMHRPSAATHWLPPALRDSGQQIDPAQLKAILPVHAFGQPADMNPILEVAERYGLTVVEDACEAPGAEYRQRRAGTMSHAAVFAFYPNKQMTTGEGGMIVTDNPEWDALFRSLRNQGRDTFNAWLDHTRLGYNYRLDEMSAALGLVQTRRIEELLAKRAQVAQWYNERLAEVELIDAPPVAETTTRMSWFVYVVRVRPPAQRNEVMQRLSEVGIPSRPYFMPIHLQRFYRQQFGYERGDFPATEHLGDVSLALPFSSVMTESQVDDVCEQLVRQVS